MYPHEAQIVAASKSLYLGTHLNEYPNAKVSERSAIPESVMRKFNSRRQVLDAQGAIMDATDGKFWDTEACLKYFIKMYQNQRYPLNIPMGTLVEWFGRYEAGDGFKEIEADVTAALERDTTNQEVVANAITGAYSIKSTLQSMTGLRSKLTADMFKPIVVWWVGLDEIEAAQGEGRRAFADYLDKSCQVNIFNVLMANIWSKVGQFSDNCDFILERCKKDFFVDLGIPKSINTNERSFQMIQRSTKQKVILSMYTV